MEGLRDVRSWLFWPTVILILGVFFFVDAHDLFWSVGELKDVSDSAAEVEEGSELRRISLLLLGAFGVFGLLRSEFKPPRPWGLPGWLMLFFVFWAFLSLTWTEDVGMTSRRLVSLAMLCLGAFGIARTLSVRSIVLMVFVVTAAYLTVGLAAEVFLRTFFPLDPDYRFAGGMHPNHQGINCGLLLLSTLFLAKDVRWWRRVLFLTAAGVAFAFLVLTRSRTSFGGVLFALLVYWSLVVPGPQKTVPVLVAGIISTLLVLFFGDALFHHFAEGLLLGRADDPDSVSLLTGRIPIWKDSVEFIVKRPLQGYGYGAFWTPHHIFEISASQNWPVAEAHSAYVELTLSLGLAGTITYVLMLLGGVLCSIRYEYFGNDCRFFGVLLIFCMLEGLLESATVAPCLIFFLSVVALVYLGFTAPSYTNNRTAR